MHIPSNRCVSGRILAKLIADTGVKKVLCGGDMPEAFGGKESIDRTIAAYREQWVKAVGRAGGEFYPAKGNHDFTIRDKPGASSGFTYSGKEAHDILMDTAAVKANAVTNPDDPESCYYWFDAPCGGIRYIVADTTDSVRTDRTYWAVKYGMGERQLKWLAENALATLPAGWVALVMHHIPVTGIVSGEAENQAIFAPWRNLLEAYQNRGRVSIGGKEYDFSNAQGRILCSLTGHEHAERQTFQNGLWHITEPCDAAYSDYIIGAAPWCKDLPKKEKGTIFEQTFDAIHIDRKNNVLHFTRIGGGADRTVRLAPLHLGFRTGRGAATTQAGRGRRGTRSTNTRASSGISMTSLKSRRRRRLSPRSRVRRLRSERWRTERGKSCRLSSRWQKGFDILFPISLCQIFLFATSIGREEENRHSCPHRRCARGGVSRCVVDLHRLERRGV